MAQRCCMCRLALSYEAGERLEDGSGIATILMRFCQTVAQ